MQKVSLGLIGGCLSLALLAACGNGGGSDSPSSAKAADGSLKGDKLTFVNYGGASMDAAKKGWLEPFSKKTGVMFGTDAPSDAAKAKAMATAGRPTWDIVDLAPVGPGECGKIYAKRPADFDASKLDPELIPDDCAVPVMATVVGLVYNKKLYGDNPPTSMADFMNRDKFPGKRVMFNYWAGTVEPLLLADGVPADQVYPIDWGRVKSALGKLGGDVVLQSTLDQQAQVQNSGDFGMCLCLLGRAAIAAETGANIGVVWDKVYLAWDNLYALKGSKSPDAQWSFLQYLATPEGQNNFYKYLPYGSTILNSPPPEVKDVYKPFMPEFNGDSILERLVADAKYVADNGPEATDKWTQLTAG